MITPQKAEKLATKYMQQYVNKCHCANMEDVANVLMMLVSVCGQCMCATVGQSDAVSRLEATATHIAKTQQKDT
jgi:hypothetical protein